MRPPGWLAVVGGLTAARLRVGSYGATVPQNSGKSARQGGDNNTHPPPRYRPPRFAVCVNISVRVLSDDGSYYLSRHGPPQVVLGVQVVVQCGGALRRDFTDGRNSGKFFGSTRRRRRGERGAETPGSGARSGTAYRTCVGGVGKSAFVAALEMRFYFVWLCVISVMFSWKI